MRLPTLYSSLDELNLDMQILGRVLQVPGQTLEELTKTFKEEMKIKNPLPTLEKRRYKISDMVSDDYEITYEEELQLAENEEQINLSVENIEINESEPIVSVSPEYKEYFVYENHATSSTLEKFLAGDTTRFSGNISQLGTTVLKKDMELSEKDIDSLSTTNETWGENGLDYDDTTEERQTVPTFEVDDDSDEEFDVSVLNGGIQTSETEVNIEDTQEEQTQTFSVDDNDAEFTLPTDEESVDVEKVYIDFIENKELTNLDGYFLEEQEESIENKKVTIEFEENFELDDLDSEVDWSSPQDIEQEEEEYDEDTGDYDEDLDEGIENYEEDVDEGIDDYEEDAENYEEDVGEESDDEGIDEDTEDYEDDLDEGIDDYEEDDLAEDFETEEDISEVEEDDLDFGDETNLVSESQGGISETTVSDEDLGFIDKATPEDLDFGTTTVSNNTEDDAYINKVLNNKRLPDALKKELIRDYLETQSRGAIEVDLGAEPVRQEEPKEVKKPTKTEEVEYKDIRHYVRDHPRCTVQEVLTHFSKKQLEHDIMIGKVIRKGKILHI